MIRSSSSLLALSALAIAITGLDVAFAASAPSSYFGGSDNDSYMTWWQDRGSNLDHSIFMPSVADPDQGTALHWTVNATHIHLGFAARALGWMGFGLSENGGMRGSDMLLFRADQPNQVTDGYVLDQLFPLEDTCQSWDLIYSQTHDGFLVIEATRLLNTGDNQDLVIKDDSDLFVEPHRIMSAWGDNEGGWTYHGNRRAASAVRFFGDGKDVMESFRASMEAEAEGSFFLGAEEFLIPNVETTYQDFCLNAAQLESAGVPLSESLHVIGVEAFVDNRTTKLVHHFTSNIQSGVNLDPNGNCLESNGLRESLYGWAPGALPLLFPSNVGIPIGSNGINAATITIHYNNPGFEEGHRDSSGIRVYWTSQKREYDVGTIPLADVAIRLDGDMVGGGYSEHSFYCQASCTDGALAGLQEPVTIVGETFHMHKTGVRATNKVIRNGEVTHSSSVEFFDYEQNGNLNVQQQPYQLQPGDAFESKFYYNTDPAGGGTKFGYSSQDEMAIVSLRYYPKPQGRNFLFVCAYGIPVPTCLVDYNSTELSSVTELGRTFGVSTDDAAVAKSISGSPACFAASTKDVHFDPDASDESPNSGGAMLQNSAILLVTATMATALAFGGV